MKVLLLACCCAATLGVAFAQTDDNASTADDPAILDEVLVTGEYPGPGLWKVTKATDDGDHVLWIFGTLRPMPIGFKWRSQQVEKIVAESQEIITPDGMGITFEERVGIFKAITLIPAVLRVRKNPDGEKLQDLLPTDVYARWSDQKAKYIGRDNGVEKWRPIAAAQELRNKALKKLRLSLTGGAWAAIRPIATEHKIKITSPSIVAKIPNKQIRSSIKNFSKAALADTECLAVTIALVEALSDATAIKARVAAWATGNLAAFHRLPALPDPSVFCEAALVQSPVVQDFHFDGFHDLAATRANKWVEVVEKALTKNHSTFVLLPIDEVLKSDGRLALLRAKGYRIEEPN